MERTITDLSRLIINAGRRGLLAEMSHEELSKILNPILVDVAI
jgi:prolyl-tRNA editing enzyme YbaK/EbsC (Cys-tRNA(Pro) deacylase)